MQKKFVFEIRPISLDTGFRLTCPGVVDQPIQTGRLMETVVLATTLGGDLDFEIQIFDVQGERTDVIELKHQPVLAD